MTLQRKSLCALLYLAAALLAGAGCASRPIEQPAAAEASGQERAVKLTLRLHKTKVRVDEPLRVQFVLTNAGSAPIPVLDDIYRYPQAVDRNLADRRRTFLELQGPDGVNLVHWRVHRRILHDEEHFCSGPARGPVYHPVEAAKEPKAILKPGESIATAAWSEKSDCTGEPRFEEIPPFITVDYLRPITPGKHRVRAVYAWAPSPDYELSSEQKPYAVVARTEWIELEAVP